MHINPPALRPYDPGVIPAQIKTAFSKILSKETLAKVSQIANHVFLHLAISLALNLAFDAAFGILILPVSAHLLTLACGVSLVLVIAIKAVKLAYAHFHAKPEKRIQGSGSFPLTKIDKLSKAVADFSIVNTLMLKVSNYIHEGGHALAAMACFVKAQPTVMVKWAQGLTEYNISYGLTKFGALLGEEAARLCVTAAGLVFPAVFALGEFAIAHGLHKDLPLISDILNYHGLSQLLNVGLYGLSAFASSKMALANDFIYLWHIGEVHPALAIALLVGLPLCALAAFKYLEYRASHDGQLLLVSSR